MSLSCNKAILPVISKPSHPQRATIENIPLNTIEDKELRKKLRNRQSALAARERKKARMMELEKKVAELQESGRRMEEENQYLRKNLEVLVRKYQQAGMPLHSENETLQMSQTVANQTNYPPHLNYDNYRRNERPELSQKRYEIPVQNFGQNYPVITGKTQGLIENRLCDEVYDERQQKALAAVSSGMRTQQQGLHNGHIFASSYQKPFVPLSQARVNGPNLSIKHENFDFPQNQTQIELQGGSIQPQCNDNYRSQTSVSLNAVNYSNCTTKTTKPLPFLPEQDQQVLTSHGVQSLSLKRSLFSIAATPDFSSKRQRSSVSTSSEMSPEHKIDRDTTRSTPLRRETRCNSHTESNIDDLLQRSNVTSCTRSLSSAEIPIVDNLLSLPTQRDFYFNSVLSEAKQNTLKTDFETHLSSNNSDTDNNNIVETIDFQDMLLDDYSSVSPSSKTGSDLSTDDPLDWVDDNLIFSL